MRSGRSTSTWCPKASRSATRRASSARADVRTTLTSWLWRWAFHVTDLLVPMDMVGAGGKQPARAVDGYTRLAGRHPILWLLREGIPQLRHALWPQTRFPRYEDFHMGLGPRLWVLHMLRRWIRTKTFCSCDVGLGCRQVSGVYQYSPVISIQFWLGWDVWAQRHCTLPEQKQNKIN